MLHPIEDDLSIYSNQELEQKVTELTKKYFRQRNPQVKQQMQQLLDMYKIFLFLLINLLLVCEIY